MFRSVLLPICCAAGVNFCPVISRRWPGVPYLKSHRLDQPGPPGVHSFPGSQCVPYAEGVAQLGPGSRSAPWEPKAHERIYPNEVGQGVTQPMCNPFGVGSAGEALFPGCAGATLGYDVQRLRRKSRRARQSRHGYINSPMTLKASWSAGRKVCYRAYGVKVDALARAVTVT